MFIPFINNAEGSNIFKNFVQQEICLMWLPEGFFLGKQNCR